MKLYCLVNNYLEGVRAGVQALHASTKLMSKYEDDSKYGTKCVDMINEWDQIHETVVLVYGGDHDDLSCTYNFLDGAEEIPFAKFHEPGMNGALTSVAMLCSTEMVDDMDAYRRKFITDDEMYDKYPELGSVLIRTAMARTVQ